jgi:hypothetical protein
MKALVCAVLLMGAETLAFAQSAVPADSGALTGSLTGKLTDLYSKPLEGVTVILRLQATGAVAARAVTAKNGVYSFSGLEPGEYALEAERAQLGRGLLEHIAISAGYEARVQAAMRFEPLEAAPLLAAARAEEQPQQPVVKVENSENLPSGAKAHPLLSSSCGTTKVVPFQNTTPITIQNTAPTTVQNTTPTTVQNTTPTTVQNTSSTADCQGKAPFQINRPVIALETLPVSSAELLTEPLQLLPLTARLTQNPAAIPAPPAPPIQPPTKPFQPAPPVNGPLSPTDSSTTTAGELQNLPVSGRHWQDFVLDNAPTSATPAGGQAEITLRGSGQPVESAVDGVSRSLAFGATSGSGQVSSGQGPLGGGGTDPAGTPQVGAGGHGLSFSESAIREVQTAGGSVEAATRAAGGRMNVETQRGTNVLHGQGFLFDRQNAWGAQNPFTQRITETTPATPSSFPAFTSVPFTPPDRETTWGIGIGGRIRRSKLFWFAALDSLNRNDPGLSTLKHPYLCADVQCTRQTGFFAQPTNDQMQVLSAQLGLSNVNPVAEGLAAYASVLRSLLELLGPSPRTTQQWTGFARLDWAATERHRFTIEAIGAHWNAPGGGLTRVSENYGNHSFGTTKASEEWLMGRWEAYITPNLLAVTQASAGDVLQTAHPQTPSAFEQGFLAGNAWGQLPQIVVDSRYGFTIGNPSRFGSGSYPNERLYQAHEAVDWVHGNLLVRSGFSLSHNADTTSLLRNQSGTYHYSNVENFVTDVLVFEKFGLKNALDPYNQHNCDETGRAWRDSGGGLRGLGYLPCYSYYSQTMGPTDWHLSTNDWALYSTVQWQPSKRVVLSAGLRWEREQRPPPLAALKNPQLPLTETLPALGNNFGPRLGLAVETGNKHAPVLRFGYGIYYARTTNLTLQTVLTQTGSLAGDLSFFMRPTDDLPNNGGGAPPFPYVLAGEPGRAIKPGAVEFASVFRNPEIHQAVVAVEESLPGHFEVTTSALLSLGRRLPVSIDTNINPPASTQTITYAVVDPAGAGPIKASQITVPFYSSDPTSVGICPYYTPTPGSTTLSGRPCPDYQQITNIESRANSTYQAAMIRVERNGHNGLTLHAHYIYGHAMDWNPNESSHAAGNDLLDPANPGLEYGVSNQDIRHSLGLTAIYRPPWKLTGLAGKFANGWMLSGVLHARSGLPYTMRTTGSLPKLFTASGAAIAGLGPGMNGSGGDNRVYGTGNDGHFYNIGRNTYRYPATWKTDFRLGKRFNLGGMRQLELLAESFNLLNHQNVTELETTGYTLQSGNPNGGLPTLNFMTGPLVDTNGSIKHPTSTAFGQPLNVNATNFYRERQFQFGLRMRF